MKTNTLSSKPTSASQSGAMLVEVMVSVLIFAFGILGIVGLQAASVAQVSDAKYRSDAALLANQLIGTMWLGDRTAAALTANFSTQANGPGYVSFKNKVAGALPGAVSNPPTVLVAPDGTVTVIIQWLAPSEPSGTDPHKYIAYAQIV